MNNLYDRLKLAVKEPKNSFMLMPEEVEEVIKLCDTAQKLREEANEIRIAALTEYRKMYPNNVDYIFMTKEQYDKKVFVYEDRINKAIEYIGEEDKYGDYENFVVPIGEENGCPIDACADLLNILQGKSDE